MAKTRFLPCAIDQIVSSSTVVVDVINSGHIYYLDTSVLWDQVVLCSVVADTSVQPLKIS